ncbi:MAG TPA: L-lactate dehydrogenase [Thermoclostridium caenicola]|uniref:L-lactate dehydrogenase n=1 Tax=Thermoclostridium caenicola TaxID=659425 RepID=UPI002B6618AA|nr:L-lactate dehydrogenase [Thermoclostridium caenicola]HOK43451.1 L-lactate dehydrogenase [Thermoclostridium caenicola]HOL84956.1 L-lactate dehydrogenase [Thermoclostridium caenicola]HPO75923.1 L-lactate dehydrogenase [Thermoclostridium caenicola]
MHQTGKTKVAIIGAGNVGASIAFAMALEQSASEIVLIDVNAEKAVGEALDINHGLCFLGQMAVYAGDYSDIASCDVIIVTAGMNRKPGQTRLDLARANVAIAKEITKNILKYYTHGVILVVSNPVDILTYKIQQWSGLPTGRVFGSGTALDSARFRFTLAQKFNVDVRNVHGYIVGEHGDTQLPLWSATHIAGMNAEEYAKMHEMPFGDEDKAKIRDDVKQAGAVIIKNKGATYYAIAVTVNTLVETLIKNQNTIRTVSSIIDGPYGIKDVAISLPSMINSNGVERIIEFPITPEEEKQLRDSADALKAILDGVSDI